MRDSGAPNSGMQRTALRAAADAGVIFHRNVFVIRRDSGNEFSWGLLMIIDASLKNI